MISIAAKGIVPAALAILVLSNVAPAQAGGYYYRARPVVVVPPPAVVYQPVVAYRAPVASVVVPAPAVVAVPAPTVVVGTPVRVSEQQVSTPGHSRYRYHVHNPQGPDYTYRVRDNGNVVRSRERWSR